MAIRTIPKPKYSDEIASSLADTYIISGGYSLDALTDNLVDYISMTQYKINDNVYLYTGGTDVAGVGVSETNGRVWLEDDEDVHFGLLPPEGVIIIANYDTDGSGNITRYEPLYVKTPLEHSSLSELTTGDDHTQYAYLDGRSGGQTLVGGTDASDNLTFDSTSDATKGEIVFNSDIDAGVNRIITSGLIPRYTSTSDTDITPDLEGVMYYQSASITSATLNINNPTNGSGSTYSRIVYITLLNLNAGGCDFVFDTKYTDCQGTALGTINITGIGESQTYMFSANGASGDDMRLLPSICQKWSRVGTDTILYNSGDNVGVGLTPSYKLDVDGNVNVSATNSYLVDGDDINTAGTLSNVAYLNQVNNFTENVDVAGNLDVQGGAALLPSPTSALADGDFANSQYMIWVDETVDEIKIKVRKSDGTYLNKTIAV